MNTYLEKFSLDGKIAYITGGLGLIGKEISIALAMSGAKTIILDIKDKKIVNNYLEQIQHRNCSINYEIFDVTDLKNIENKIDSLTTKYGIPDIWINNAYPRTNDWGNRVEDLNIVSWRKNVDMHLNSYSWISRYICLMMKENRGGSLINIGSIYGLLGNDFTVYEGTEMTGPMAYSAIKAGIVNLSRYLASYFGSYNVRVNNICPGGIFENQDEKFTKKYSEKTLLKRLGNADEIAPAVVFLSSDAASYITGTTLIVDGGWTAI